MTIAETAARLMREQGLQYVTYGDGTMVEIGVEAGIDAHPLDTMRRVCAALRRAPHLFEHGRMLGLDSRGRNRFVNSYRLLDQDAPG